MSNIILISIVLAIILFYEGLYIMKSWDCSIDYLRTRDNDKEYYSAKLFMEKERRDVIFISSILGLQIILFVIYLLFIN